MFSRGIEKQHRVVMFNSSKPITIFTKSSMVAQSTITCSKFPAEHSDVFIVNTERISHRTYFTPCSSVSIVNFEHVIAAWDMFKWVLNTHLFYALQVKGSSDLSIKIRYLIQPIMVNLVNLPLVNKSDWLSKSGVQPIKFIET